MSPLLSIQHLSKSFGAQTLFEDLSFTLHQKDRIGLFGPNGAGKSTLLKILAGLENPDKGTLSKRDSLRIGYVPQSAEFDSKSLLDTLLDTRDKEQELLAKTLLSKAQFLDPQQEASTLSGGWKKRLSILKALMQKPDLLLLDEPTNHLDLEGILWLEEFLLKENLSYLLISHDRYLLDKLCNKMIELNRCYPDGLLMLKGGLTEFLDFKERFLLSQQEKERGLASTLKKEIDWLKRSPKARTTKAESRVQNTHRLLKEFSAVKKRNQVTKVAIDFSASKTETKNLMAMKNLTKALSGKTLFQGIDLTLSPGMRLGIVGKNGTGKTTFLKILKGKIPQDAGTLKVADDLRIVYFDQHKEQIPLDTTLKEALCPSGEMVKYRDEYIHVNGWAKRFLFPSDKLILPLRCLSGGERARIQIAKLMLEPADVLLLDEPTNDLDIETLEVLEESLNTFEGAVVLITHDRCLMDRVCTTILALGEEEKGRFFADYAQWESTKQSPPKEKPLKPPSAPRAQKLSSSEKKELANMEKTIVTLEEKSKQLEALALKAQEESDTKRSLELFAELGAVNEQLEKAFERWQELEAR